MSSTVYVRRLSVVSLIIVLLISCHPLFVPVVKADTFNQIPLWINVMEGATASRDQIDQVEKEMDAVFAKAGLNWRVTSVIMDENAPDPDKSNDQPGDVREGDEEDGLYRKGKKEVENLAGCKVYVVRAILNGTGDDTGLIGGAEIVPGTRTVVLRSNYTDGTPVAGQVWGHELGHILGLGHEYPNGTDRPASDLMHRYVPGGTNLTADDVATMNQTKYERDLGIPSLTDDQKGRNYDEYHSEGDDPIGDSFYNWTDIFQGYFSFFVLDATRNLYISGLLGGLIPLGAGVNCYVALDTDNNPATGGEFQGWLGTDFLIMIHATPPDSVESFLYKYPEMMPIAPLVTRIDTEVRDRCVSGPPLRPTVPLQNKIVIKVPLMLLGPLADPIGIAMSTQSADGLGTDRLEKMPVKTSPPTRPTLTLNPPTASVGTLITATGFGFTPTNGVSIVFNHLNLSTTTVNPDGSFTTTFTVPNLATTHYMVDAIDSSHQVGVSMFTITHTHGMGDINADGIVDIYDAILLANAYNSIPGSANWNPDADLNKDSIVDIYDAILLANNYNQNYP